MRKNTEQIILDIARKHFIRNGFSATRMQKIADEANINKAMLHYYYRSKDKLYQEILYNTLSKAIPRFTNAMNSKGSLWDRIEHLVDTYITTTIEYPELPLFIMTELSQKRKNFIEILKKHSSFYPALQSFIQKIQIEMTKGSIKEVPPIHLLLNILGMSIFPFMAKPMICTVFEVSEKEFTALMKARKSIILDLIKNGMKVE